MATPPCGYPDPGGRAGLPYGSTIPANPSPLRETTEAQALFRDRTPESPQPSTNLDSPSPYLPSTKEQLLRMLAFQHPFPVLNGGGLLGIPGPSTARAINLNGALDTPPNSRGTHAASTDQSGPMGNFAYKSLGDPFTTPKGKEVQTSTAVSRIIAEDSPALTENFSPREDRLGKIIDAETAQGVFSPKACVFVANLSNQKTDEQLEESVHKVYDEHGSCWVKIRRDRNKMPFAFVQYETIEAADEAIKMARGRIIDGRSTRCEHAKVNRALYLTRHTGGPISDAEARELLEPFGSISIATPISLIDQQFLNLPEGIVVQFAYFQDARDAQLALKHHEVYRVVIPQSALEYRSPAGSLASPSSYRRRPNIGYNARRANEDPTSIFVGNLAQDTTNEQLLEAFAVYGKALANIVSKPGPHGGMNTFAFLTFETPAEAQAAVQAQIKLNGQQLRVEYKEASNRRVMRNFGNFNYEQNPVASNPYAQAMQFVLTPDEHAQLYNAVPPGWPGPPAPQGFYQAPPMSMQPTGPLRPVPMPAYSGQVKAHGLPYNDLYAKYLESLAAWENPNVAARAQSLRFAIEDTLAGISIDDM